MSKAVQGAGRFQLKWLAVVVAATCHGVAFAEEATAVDPLALPTQTVTGAQDQPQGPDFGYNAAKSLTASKTSTPLSETPRSVSVVTRKRMEDQKSQSLTDVLGYVPGIFAPPFAAGDGLAGDLFFIRGFNATDYGYGLLRDGLRVQGNRYDTTSEPYGLERVEVFRGPTSILYGENAPGGLVNLVSKRPTAVAQREVQLSYGSNDRRQLNIDVGGPLDESGNILGRVVMVGRVADTQVDHVQDDRLYIAPSLTFNFDEFNTLTLLSTYQKDRTKLELGLPAAGTLLSNPNGKLDKDTLTGHPDWDDFDREVWTAGYEFTHLINDDWQFRQNSRYMQSRIQRNEIWPNAGLSSNYRNPVTQFLPGGISYQGLARDRYNKSITYSLDNQLEGKFNTGAFQNTLLLGVSFDRTSFNQDQDVGVISTIDYYNPAWGTVGEPTTPFSQTNTLLEQQMTGLYSQLQSKYENWIFLLGGRFDSVDNSYRAKSTVFSPTATELDYSDHKGTWQTGVMYQFENGLSPYVSYSTAFVPVQEVSATSGPLDPTTAEQYEVGLKYEPKGWNTMFTAAVFDLRKENDVYFESAINDYRQVGESRSKGVELEVNSDITANLNVTAAYTYTDARITKDAPGSLLEDNQMTGVPRNQASVWANYRFLDGALRGLRLGGGVRHFDSTFAYTAEPGTNPAVVSYGRLDTGDVTLVDAAIGYEIDKNWSVDLNAKNVFDQEYVAGCNNAGRCYWGDERTLLGTVSLRW
ncbi:MAG: TonB-dependent siderophore receptor [Gammaproteobacteria bacterium]|nr:TonB-dependent siderophore receptor [Gammaproteobacteria bacterium]MBU1489281.1 TonB-dependent siderophore receptor [Gammaproteobacteria bacterium]MBU2064468.1 TonB-dependent siderophore receptor [Gammaproteobacteria bacterium]MBU2137275.1 TonB-dependent siderophore receptor [Gammaproteobacteria bacterium]MBU2217320.1 TonB-dependent siderophore receptor [Gammaproteobacteria bacterium]